MLQSNPNICCNRILLAWFWGRPRRPATTAFLSLWVMLGFHFFSVGKFDPTTMKHQIQKALEKQECKIAKEEGSWQT